MSKRIQTGSLTISSRYGVVSGSTVSEFGRGSEFYGMSAAGWAKWVSRTVSKSEGSYAALRTFEFDDEEPLHKRFMRIQYPEQSSSPGDTYSGDTEATSGLEGQTRPLGGYLSSRIRKLVPFPSSAQSRVIFRPGPSFDYRMGGKLFVSIGGGVIPTSGDGIATGGAGFRARVMWGAGGKILPYIYHPNQPGVYGDGLGFTSANSPISITSGWNELLLRVEMNDVGQSNGRLLIEMNDQTLTDQTNFVWATIAGVVPEYFELDTFFGGNTASDGDDTWETLTDQYMDVAEYEVKQS